MRLVSVSVTALFMMLCFPIANQSGPHLNRAHCVVLCFTPALLFAGKVKVNPAHPKQIGSIDPNCRVTDVVKGENLSF